MCSVRKSTTAREWGTMGTQPIFVQLVGREGSEELLVYTPYVFDEQEPVYTGGLHEAVA